MISSSDKALLIALVAGAGVALLAGHFLLKRFNLSPEDKSVVNQAMRVWAHARAGKVIASKVLR